MAWDAAWDRVYERGQWGKYPPEELVRFMARSFGVDRDHSQVRVLELGCGSGANLWFLARESYAATGIDAAAKALAMARRRLEAEGLRAGLVSGDVSDITEVFAGTRFDAVIDICCLQCNSFAESCMMAEKACEILKPGGRFFSMLSSRGSWGDGLGRQIEPGTFTAIGEGPYSGLGVNHFFDRPEVEALAATFSSAQIDYSERTHDNGRYRIGHWLLSAVRE